jgi:hypothetical protein
MVLSVIHPLGCNSYGAVKLIIIKGKIFQERDNSVSERYTNTYFFAHSSIPTNDLARKDKGTDLLQ